VENLPREIVLNGLEYAILIINGLVMAIDAIDVVNVVNVVNVINVEYALKIR